MAATQFVLSLLAIFCLSTALTFDLYDDDTIIIAERDTTATTDITTTTTTTTTTDTTTTTTSVPTTTTYPQDPICDIKGTWDGCSGQRFTAADNYNGCFVNCNSTGAGNCTHFTFFPGTQLRKPVCHLQTGCTNFTEDGCEDCRSGERDCGSLECGLQDCCQGKSVGQKFEIEVEDCLNFCNNKTGCHWFSYLKDFRACFLYDSCNTNSTSGSGECISGQHGCTQVDLGDDPICGEKKCCEDAFEKQFVLPSADSCLQKCKSFTNPADFKCEWFTFFKTPKLCLLYESRCTSQSVEGEECISGEQSCTSAEPCWETGQVIGNKNSSSKVTNRDLCFEKCLDDPGCVYLTYYSTTVCSLFHSFDELNQCTNCFSRSRHCQ